MTSSDHSKKRVAYYYDPDIKEFYYGSEHSMKPRRIDMTHQLILNYGLYSKLQVFKPKPASFEDMTVFHDKEYINFLQSVNFENAEKLLDQTIQFHVGSEISDCPAFDGLYKFCQISSGASLAAAEKLNKQRADIVINWMGGLHHAKKSKASGFCYTNDIVLAVLELLKHHKRVLYVDIDVHHGDGVEEAFYYTDRVMTVSFHQYGKGFFPGTGSLEDIGKESGRLYSVNVPLRKYIKDENYQRVFQPIMKKVMEVYRPDVVVLQCGADSLVDDHLGEFNLTIKGHSECVKFFQNYDVQLLLLGGGGYKPTNVARCWAYETALIVGVDLPDKVPYTDYYEYFYPGGYRLHIDPSSDYDENSDDYINSTVARVLANLNELQGPPSVQMQHIPEDAITIDTSSEIEDADVRLPGIISDQLVADVGEFYMSE